MNTFNYRRAVNELRVAYSEDFAEYVINYLKDKGLQEGYVPAYASSKYRLELPEELPELRMTNSVLVEKYNKWMIVSPDDRGFDIVDVSKITNFTDNGMLASYIEHDEYFTILREQVLAYSPYVYTVPVTDKHWEDLSRKFTMEAIIKAFSEYEIKITFSEDMSEVILTK